MQKAKKSLFTMSSQSDLPLPQDSTDYALETGEQNQTIAGLNRGLEQMAPGDVWLL
jgi:hypothetical protein